MSSLSATQKVCPYPDGRELEQHNGIESLDPLLNDATAETVAVGLICLELGRNRSALVPMLEVCIQERLEPFLTGELSHTLDESAELSPSRQ